MAIKEYKTIDEQIALLRSRGLAIADEELARDFFYGITIIGSVGIL